MKLALSETPLTGFVATRPNCYCEQSGGGGMGVLYYSSLSKSCKSLHFQVTGANKGVGFAIVRGICKKFNGDVFLTGKFVSIRT